jgi:pimeloyl-ACP methyl ester carboxylesterase
LTGYSIFAPDLPGHGRSSKGGRQSIEGYTDDILGWLGALDIHTAIFIGHSMGSAIAQILAIEHPECVSGLGLIGSAARLRVNPVLIQESSNESTFHLAVEKIVAWSFSEHVADNLKALVARRMAETHHSILHGDLIACDHHDISDSMSLIHCPTLVLSGAEDRMTPVRQAHYLADHIPATQLEIIPHAGHMVMLERPYEVADALRRFLSGISR